MPTTRTMTWHVFLVCAMLCACLALAGEGFAFRRHSSVTGPGGRSVTNSATTTRTPYGYSRSATTTGPGQQSVTRARQGQWNPATKTWNNTTTYTGPQGNSAGVTRSTTFGE